MARGGEEARDCMRVLHVPRDSDNLLAWKIDRFPTYTEYVLLACLYSEVPHQIIVDICR